MDTPHFFEKYVILVRSMGEWAPIAEALGCYYRTYVWASGAAIENADAFHVYEDGTLIGLLLQSDDLVYLTTNHRVDRKKYAIDMGKTILCAEQAMKILNRELGR